MPYLADMQDTQTTQHKTPKRKIDRAQAIANANENKNRPSPTPGFAQSSYFNIPILCINGTQRLAIGATDSHRPTQRVPGRTLPKPAVPVRNPRAGLRSRALARPALAQGAVHNAHHTLSVVARDPAAADALQLLVQLPVQLADRTDDHPSLHALTEAQKRVTSKHGTNQRQRKMRSEQSDRGQLLRSLGGPEHRLVTHEGPVQGQSGQVYDQRDRRETKYRGPSRRADDRFHTRDAPAASHNRTKQNRYPQSRGRDQANRSRCVRKCPQGPIPAAQHPRRLIDNLAASAGGTATLGRARLGADNRQLLGSGRGFQRGPANVRKVYNTERIWMTDARITANADQVTVIRNWTMAAETCGRGAWCMA